MQVDAARVVIAGFAGDSGKTLVATGLARALRDRGLKVAAFKKGPDYIDTAWLGAAAGSLAHNLDLFLAPPEAITASVARLGGAADVSVIEGNRGLFDGVDASGTYSTAELAKLLGAPVILVVDARKATTTLAALVMGCRAMDPALDVAGVILNRVGTKRQEDVASEAIASMAGVPVLGALPRLTDLDLPSRHLGLITVAEHPRAEEMIEKAADMMRRSADLDAILAAARRAGRLQAPARERVARAPQAHQVRIGVARDEAFSFYYPENLTALEEAGAELVPVSPIADASLPSVDALYFGGGFPEIYARALTRNRAFRAAVARKIAEGLPVWAECGGTMYLARELVVEGVAYPMVGALPVTVEQTARPQGHGYVVARVDEPNPFLPEGGVLRGHEFHYSRIAGGFDGVRTVLAVDRGIGVGGGRDGLELENVVACYTHLHALGAPDWAPGLVRAARGHA